MSPRVAMLPEGRRMLDLAVADGVGDREGAVAAARNRDEVRIAMVALDGPDRVTDGDAGDVAFQLLDALSRTGEPDGALDDVERAPVLAAVAASIRPGRFRAAVVGAPVALFAADRRRALHRIAGGPPTSVAGGVRCRSISSSFGRGATVAMLIGDIDDDLCRQRPLGRCDGAELLRAIRHDAPHVGAIALVRRR